MPGRDGTGPMGQGSLTGRGMGFCNDANARNNVGFVRGIGRGMRRCAGFGMGLGRGWRPFGQELNYSASEKEQLNHQKNILKNQLEEIDERLNDLDRTEE
ncbi:MAG TPA: hypothetical protein DHN33_02015 [Eubacteriaceae bacterium]|nr:hypothetical protein [Eubacteriaceae bacterium]